MRQKTAARQLPMSARDNNAADVRWRGHAGCVAGFGRWVKHCGTALFGRLSVEIA
jgi:hypothetical protein